MEPNPLDSSGVADEPFELPPAHEWEKERDAESSASAERPVREPRPARAPRSRRRRLRPLRWLVLLVLLAAVFAAGLFVGRALEETPKPGGEFVRVRTLQPSTVGPQTTVTVTVEE